MAEFTVRITGVPPPPLKKPRTKKSAAPTLQQRYNLCLSPSTSLNEFESNIYALFNVAVLNRSKYSMEFLMGFPPRLLDKRGKNTVDELGIRANENVIVKISLVEDVPATSTTDCASPATNKKNNKAENGEFAPNQKQEVTTSTTNRKKRAAAEMASSSFKEVIKAQEAMMKSEKKSSKSSAKSNSARITTIKTSSPKKKKIEGVGYRLSDSQAFDSSTKRTKRQRNSEPMFSSQDDITNTLLSSLNGQKGNIGNFLRAAMKGAVMKAYEVSRAQVRVSAVENGDYDYERVKSLTGVKGGNLLGSVNNDELDRTMYQVSYGKGIEGRGRFCDQVEIIGLDVLKSTIKTVYNSKTSDEEDGMNDGREMLRPAAIAQMSPRMFWSLIYHCIIAKKEELGDMSKSSSVESTLRLTMPELNWDHLDRGGRKRNLSEKAKENLRQEKGDTETSTTDNYIEGIRALEEIEDTLMSSIDRNEDDLRKKRLEALSRFDKKYTNMTDDWKLIIPDEEDQDELKECILDQNDITEEIAKMYSSILLSAEQPSCRNWRELANANPEIMTTKFITECNKMKIDQPSFDCVNAWIDAAQRRSLDEIMLEILDSDQDALELLAEKANSANPWDLTQWQSYPHLLLETIESTKYTNQDATRWISRANIAIQTCKWLEDYSVSVV